MTTTPTLEHESILAELITQFVDSKFGRHTPNCYEPNRSRPSSIRDPTALYKSYRRDSMNRHAGDLSHPDVAAGPRVRSMSFSSDRTLAEIEDS